MRSRILMVLVGALLSTACQQKPAPKESPSTTPTPSPTASASQQSGHIAFLPFVVSMDIETEGKWEEIVTITGSEQGNVNVKLKYADAPEFLKMESDGQLQMGGHATVFELTPEGVVLENGKSSGYRFKTDDTLLYQEQPAFAREGELIKDKFSEDGLVMFEETMMRVRMDGDEKATRQAIFALNCYMRASNAQLEEEEAGEPQPTGPKDEATLESLSADSPKDEATLEDIGDEFRP